MGRKNFQELEREDEDTHVPTKTLFNDELDKRIDAHSKALCAFKEEASEHIYFQSHGVTWLNNFSYREWDDFLDTLYR